MNQSRGAAFSFQYYIDLGNNKISHILINEQSDPYVEASKFCAKEALPSILVTVLGDAMRDQMQHQRSLVEARQRKNTTEGKREKTEVMVEAGTLNTQLKEEGSGNLSQWLQEQPKGREKRSQLADRTNIFENLYNNYKEIEKRKELSRKKSFESIPFRPQINHLSEKIVLNKRKVEEEIISAAELKRSQEKFAPAERSSSKTKIGYTVSSFQNEGRPSSKDSIYNRTASYLKRSEEKRKRLRESIEKKLMEGCSFKPRINSNRFR